MINFAVGMFCTLVAFLTPLDWLAALNFFLGGYNIAVGISSWRDIRA